MRNGMRWGIFSKGFGGKLSFINKLEDVNAIQMLRNTLERIWAAVLIA
jgi:hypothetical protein